MISALFALAMLILSRKLIFLEENFELKLGLILHLMGVALGYWGVNYACLKLYGAFHKQKAKVQAKNY